jgi:hypothetical protein
MTQLSAGFRQRRLEPYGLAFTKDNSLFGNLPDTNPGSLQILDDRDRGATATRRLSNGPEGGGVRVVSAVRKVQPGDIHALFDQPD